ncbi:MAG: hypothetical protein DRZ82_07880 [Thermoprotei archaeon]|nr:MAG: hypothetical protein DRZ82_07880 [Thermoprotei archaeon]
MIWADYLMMLKTLICIRSEHVVVRARNGEVWVGRLSAIDPDHLNILLINAENIILITLTILLNANPTINPLFYCCY